MHTYPSVRSFETVDELSLDERKILVNAPELSLDVIVQLAADEDDTVRLAAVTRHDSTTELMEKLLDERPELEGTLWQHDLAPMRLMRKRPVWMGTTDFRVLFARANGATAEQVEQFVAEASALTLSDSERTIGELWDEIASR